MSLSIQLAKEIEIVSQPAVKTTLPTTVNIERIVDIPSQKEVAVFVQGLGRVILTELSGDNYDAPAEWSNASIVTALTNHINGLSA